MDAKNFMEQFQDYLAPKLDVYEQAVYLYIFTHSRLIGFEQVSVGFKSARTRMALGIGKAGTPPSDRKIYDALRSLAKKGCLELLGSDRKGSRVRLKLPDEIPGVITAKVVPTEVNIEEIDFFSVLENRLAIVEREQWQCFYCLRKLDKDNYVIEHVISRPNGNNSYRNVVAACVACNNKKGNIDVESFLRIMYRSNYLSDNDLQDRLDALQRLKDGELKPKI